MRLHPEMPLVALLRLVHLRVAGLLLVLRRRRRGDDRRIDDGALTHQQAALSSIAPTSSNSARVRSCSSSQWRKFSTVVASGTAATDRSMPAKPRSAWLS